ncbi:UNVERIFIED_CONTAM: Transcriptional repressor NF-X1 [Trichonephila clavipes]
MLPMVQGRLGCCFEILHDSGAILYKIFLILIDPQFLQIVGSQPEYMTQLKLKSGRIVGPGWPPITNINQLKYCFLNLFFSRFDELRCHCGESVLYPPIHCGTPPPECTKPCIRSHPCDHDVKHTCHSEETCPPCTTLTSKWCYGHHKKCVNVMCFLDGVSCGMMCSKNLPCGRHQCKLTCHAGLCLKEDSKCTQLCTTPRSFCGHPCGNPCHDNQCPETPCKFMVTLVCPCGEQSKTTTCHDSTKSYQFIPVSVLVSKMQEVKEGQSVNLNDLRKKSKNSKLQCGEACARRERNRRLAVALQIDNPDLSPSPGPPNYSDFLKTEAKKNPSFVTDVYDKISELVQLAKDSKQKCRSHSFPPMNRDHRKVIHELAEFFGCETQSYDEEPKKSVVVTAYKIMLYSSDSQSDLYRPPGVYEDLQGVHISKNIIWGSIRCKWGSKIVALIKADRD